jgi:hypothetical protein
MNTKKRAIKRGKKDGREKNSSDNTQILIIDGSAFSYMQKNGYILTELCRL